MTQLYILHASDQRRATVLANAHAFLDRLPADRSWELQIKRHAKTRTLKQNRALFGPCYDTLCEFCGYQGAREKERLHWQMCGEFFGWKPDPLLGQVPERTTTTNELGEYDVIDTRTMAEFYAFLQRKGASIGCDVADPDPFWQENQA